MLLFHACARVMYVVVRLLRIISNTMFTISSDSTDELKLLSRLLTEADVSLSSRTEEEVGLI